MTYVVSNTDGSLTLAIEDSTINGTDYSVVLLGKNVIDYGKYFAQNSIRQLENFAGSAPPSAANILVGQLWFDKSTGTLKVYNNTWKPVSTQHAQVDKIINYSGITNLPPNANVQYAGAVYNNVDKKLYIDNGTKIQVAGYGGEVTSRYSTDTILGRPNNYGTRIRTIFLTDTADVPRAVLAMVYVNDTSNGAMNQGTTTTRWGKETIMMIMSDHDDFVAKNATSYTEGEDINYHPELSDSNGIGTTIFRGTNIRNDYGTSIELANQAHKANIAYHLDTTGTYGNPTTGIVIPAGDFIHVARSYNPTILTATLGNQTQRFAQGYINNLQSYTLTVGNDPSNPYPNTGFVLPTTRGISGQVLTTNGAGGTSWSTVASGGGGGGATTLAGLNDVQLTSLTDGNALRYNTSSGKWVNTQFNLDSLTDVVISAPSNGQVLKYNGTNWVNDTDATGGGGGSITIPGSSGQVLYNNAGSLGALSTLTFASGTPNTYTLTGNLNIVRNGATTNGAINFGTTNQYLKYEGGIFTLSAPVTVLAPLRVSPPGGANEGGEIQLVKAATGSSLTTGDLVIDLFQNKFRVFDSGGTQKGMYATITACADAVGTEIVHSTNFNNYFDARILTTPGLPPVPRAYGTVNAQNPPVINHGAGFTATRVVTTPGKLTITLTSAAASGISTTDGASLLILVTAHSGGLVTGTSGTDDGNNGSSAFVYQTAYNSFDIYTGRGRDTWDYDERKISFVAYYKNDF